MNHSDRFIEYMLTERRASECTAVNYRADLERFMAYMEQSADEFDPAAITKIDLRGWVMAQMESGVAVGSINRNLSTLRSFFRYMIRSGVVASNPTATLHALKTGRSLPHFVEQSRMDPLLDVIAEPSEDYPTERDAMIVMLLYGCGLRRSELAGLALDSLNFAEGTLKVFGKGAKERLIPLAGPIISRLEHYLIIRKRENICNPQEKSLFLSNKAKPISDAKVYSIVREYLTLAGVQGQRSPHVLRHTFATHLMQHGASIRSVQQLLGHESLAATQIYTHNTVEHLRKSYNAAHPRAHTASVGRDLAPATADNLREELLTPKHPTIMKIQIQSVKFDADAKLIAFVETKIGKLERLNDKTTNVDVTLRLDKDHELGNKVATIVMAVPGSELVAERRSKSFEEAIDSAVDALKKQIEHYKNK